MRHYKQIYAVYVKGKLRWHLDGLFRVESAGRGEGPLRHPVVNICGSQPFLNVTRMDPTIIILPELFGLIGFLLWIALTAWERRRRFQLMSDFHMGLFDRLGSLKEFSDFVRTEEGQALMKLVMTDPQVEAARSGIIRALQIGVVLLSLSVGLFAVGRTVLVDAGQSRQLLDAMSILSLALAVGSVASGLVAAWMARAIAIDRTQQ